MKQKTLSLNQIHEQFRPIIREIGYRRLSKRCGVPETTLQRVANAESSPAIAILDKVATATGFAFKAIRINAEALRSSKPARRSTPRKTRKNR